jgi:Ca2+/H+ antiporter, TMEM165/GDT1 family
MATENVVTELEPEGTLQALLQAFAMIIVSEIGDKTFLIAAILAMSNPRMVVFAGAFGSLVAMSALSAAMGHILPTLLPRRWTQIAAGILFLVFGTKMFVEGRQMKAGNEKIQEEMKEAEEEIEEDDARHEGIDAVEGSDGHLVPMQVLEAGQSTVFAEDTPSRSRSAKPSLVDGARNFCSFFLGPVFVKAFILTFLGEWGDRSQIATIALGAAHNAYLVALGTIVGHACCTALAVIGGKYISTKISAKHITLGGAVLFLLFGVLYLYQVFTDSTADDISIPIINHPEDT